MILLYFIILYVTLGVVFYIPFIVHGMMVTDPDTRESSLFFRLMIFPGVIIFWPVLLRKWLKNLR